MPAFSARLLKVCDEPVALAGPWLVEQLLHVALHLGEFLEGRCAIHHRVISR
jgi:hypothetical protein